MFGGHLYQPKRKNLMQKVRIREIAHVLDSSLLVKGRLTEMEAGTVQCKTCKIHAC